MISMDTIANKEPDSRSPLQQINMSIIFLGPQTVHKEIRSEAVHKNLFLYTIFLFL